MIKGLSALDPDSIDIDLKPQSLRTKLDEKLQDSAVIKLIRLVYMRRVSIRHFRWNHLYIELYVIRYSHTLETFCAFNFRHLKELRQTFLQWKFHDLRYCSVVA